MDTNAVIKLIEIFDSSRLTDMELESGDLKLRLAKAAADSCRAAVSVPAGAQSEEKEENYTRIKSPLVGTFYRSPAAGGIPFVSTGSHVSEGDVVCIVEAMKAMNEIKSPCAGTVRRICVSDGDMVRYDDRLILIEED